MTYGDPTTETIRERVTVERPVAVVSEPVVPATSTVLDEYVGFHYHIGERSLLAAVACSHSGSRRAPRA